MKGVGVTHGVWVNDSLNRLERIMAELGRSPLTLAELERYERALAGAHAKNIERLAEYPITQLEQA